MSNKLYLLPVVFAYVMLITGCTNDESGLNEFSQDKEIWELEATLNLEFFEEVKKHIESELATIDEERDLKSFIDWNKEKLGFDVNEEASEGYIEVQIKDRELHESFPDTLLGYGQGVLTINEHTFPFEGDVGIHQFLHNDQIYYYAAFNTDIVNLKGEEDIFPLMLAWNTETREVHAQVTVGVGEEHGLLVFGEKFDAMFMIDEEDVIPWSE
ncbi:hypothetical protein [Bacillus sp. FJAT-45350]|uniref:hypothetical protein n=1 Tax=Bacillus sp. FJAT-45350 TaxID=2011014 RepID=UPI000BB80076|nr:hypothetical protein [Bacillus sp. FJAT-45350]